MIEHLVSLTIPSMTQPLIVLDTNVLVAALRSRCGASYRVLSQVGQSRFTMAISVPLVMEYEDVLTRPGMVPISRSAVDAVLDYLCAVGQRQRIFYLWRPKLRDPKDDMVLELAMNAGADAIVTHNVHDYVAAQGMGPAIVTPATWLESLPELKL